MFCLIGSSSAVDPPMVSGDQSARKPKRIQALPGTTGQARSTTRTAAQAPLTEHRHKLIMASNPKLFPPFRAEHIGSLLRPTTLKTAGKAFQQREISGDEYFAVLDREVARVVRLQESVGLKSITDGEFGKTSWFGLSFFNSVNFWYLILKLSKNAFSFFMSRGSVWYW